MELVLPLKEKNADDLEGVSFLKLKEEIPSRELRYPYPYISPPWEKENHLQTYHPWGCVSSQEGKPKVWCQIQYIFPRLPTCEQLGWTEFDFSGSNSCFTKIGVLESSDIKRRDSIRNSASFSNYHQESAQKKAQVQDWKICHKTQLHKLHNWNYWKFPFQHLRSKMRHQRGAHPKLRWIPSHQFGVWFFERCCCDLRNMTSYYPPGWFSGG